MVVYHGPSRIDGKPIVVIAVGRSRNTKTGNMVQTYILLADVSPIEASKQGEDRSICGNCPHRGKADGEHANGRSCYVNLGQGPRSVWEAWRRGKYAKFSPKLASIMLNGRILRIGTYGDPAAVPVEVWRKLMKLASGHTAYTHQWMKARYQGYRQFCMASVETQEQANKAHALGWRTFRVRSADSVLSAGEIVCPASNEAGKRLTCEQCQACDGAGKNAKRSSVAIIGHGGSAVTANVGRLLIQLNLKK